MPGPNGSSCVVCRFDFVECYGPMGQGLIHLHRVTKPASPSEDAGHSVVQVVPLCANCHRVAHRKEPAYTPEELRWMLARAPLANRIFAM